MKTFQALKNITKLTIIGQVQDRTKIKVGEFIGFRDVSDRGWKIFFGSNKRLNLHISFLLTQRSDYGLYEEIDDHSSYVFTRWGQTTPQMGRERVGYFFSRWRLQAGKGLWVYGRRDFGPSQPT